MIFIDCESAGLRGEIFACAMVNETGEVIFDGFYRHPVLKTNIWLRENVEPNLTGAEYPGKGEFLRAAAKAWGENKGPAVAHMGSPVEANFFQELFNEGLIGEFDGPYPLHDTAPLLLKAGHDPTSEHEYAKLVGIKLPANYVPHSALADAQLTRLVWKNLT